jgi:hypothetical protein
MVFISHSSKDRSTADAICAHLESAGINQLRVGKLKRPLARWLTTRMSHNYRQAHRPHFVNTGGEIVWKREGYHISLSTILAERGMTREARLRDNVATVRMALEEMKQAAFLAVDHPYDEKLSYTAGKGGKMITDAVWPSSPLSHSSKRKSKVTPKWRIIGPSGQPTSGPGFPDLRDEPATRGK